MGALFAWIVRGLAYAGPAAIGYFLNDLGTWAAGLVTKVSPGTNVRDNSGGWAWWFLIPVIAVAGAGFLIVMNMLTGKRKLFSLALLGCFVFDLAFGNVSGIHYVAAGILGTIPASSTDSFSIPFCPQIVILETADFSALRIEVKDDGQVFNLDGTGILAMEDIGFTGADTTNNLHAFRVANGFVLKTTTFTATNTDVAARTIRGFSMAEASGGPNGKGLWTEFTQTQAFANVEFRLKNFSFAAFPSAALTDSFTVAWASGKSDNVNAAELRVLLATTQFNETIAIDNRAGIVSEIRFTGAAQQTVYYSKLKAVL